MNFINEILHSDGKIRKHNDLPDNVRLLVSPFEYMSIVDAIPLLWRQKLRKDKTVPMTPLAEAVHLKLNKISKPVYLIQSKDIYWYLHDLSKCEPTCKTSWEDKYNIEFTKEAWKVIFCLPFKITLDAKL